MSIWISGLCAGGLTLSLWLIYRWRLGAASALLNLGIWALAWALCNPPHWLPAATGAALETDAEAGFTDPAQLVQEYPGLERLAVRGDGLPQQAWRDLPPLRLQPERPAPAPAWRPEWQPRLALGEQLRLRLHDADGLADAELALLDPFGTEVDKVHAGPESTDLQLADVPRLPGRWLYQLEIRQRGEVRREPVPVLVHEQQTPRIFLWLARPSFETAALSRWLRQSGVPAQVLTTLAPGIEQRQLLNGLQPAGDDPLHGDFDLLVVDSHLWPQLTPPQVRRLLALAREKSLLWLVRGDSPEAFLEHARSQRLGLREAVVEAVWDPQAPALALSYRAQAPAAADRLLTGSDGETLYWGRVGASHSQGLVLFENSYRWLTGGFEADFSRLWKTVFDHQLAYSGGGEPLRIEPPVPRAKHRVTLCSRDFDAALPQVAALETPAARSQLLAAPAAAPGRRCAAFWPRAAGWYRVQGAGEAGEFYVFPADAWPWWQRWTARADTARMAGARLGPEPAGAANRAPLPRHWAALLLLLLLALAWWGERTERRKRREIS